MIERSSPDIEDAMGVTERDREFAAQILEDFSSFEEGIENQEKLAQWIRNVRRNAASVPDAAARAPDHSELIEILEEHGREGDGACEVAAKVIKSLTSAAQGKIDPATVETCAKVAEGTAPVAAGNFFAARRDQCSKIAAKIRALSMTAYSHTRPHRESGK